MSINAVLIGYLVIAVITAVFLTGVCIVARRKVKFDDFITIITAAPFLAYCYLHCNNVPS